MGLALKFLRKIPMFSTLSLRDLRVLYNISRVLDIAPGQPIFSKAESASHMFVVMMGRVKIFTRSHSRKSKTLAYLSPGDVFGEMAILEGKTRSASAQAVEASRLLLISKTDFRKLLAAEPRLAYFMLRTVSERLRRANEEIESLLFRNILGRVSKVLCDLCRDTGKTYRTGTLLSNHYTHQELADLVGTTREPLTRALSTLRRADLIDTRKGQYFIKNPEKLAGLCLSTS